MTKAVAAALGLEAAVMAGMLTVALDQYAHKRVEQLGGVNVWGYRGAVMPARELNEVRIAVVGGDLAFGWGVGAGETVAPMVRRLVSLAVDQPGEIRRAVTDVNLAARGLPLYQYARRIHAYKYLTPDVICLYVDLARFSDGSVLPAHDSAVTALTGYVPMLPLVLEEKGRLLTRYGAGVRGALAEAVGVALRAVDRWLYTLFDDGDSNVPSDRRVALAHAIDAALAVAGGVVVVLPAPMTPADRTAHAWMLEASEGRAETEPRLRVVDLGRHPRLYDADVRIDGVNFGAGGHAIAAELIAPAVIDLLAAEAASLRAEFALD